MSVDQVRARRLKAFAAYHALESLPMPVVAVVHGAALGSGVEIAAACDFIVATPDAAFGHARGDARNGRRDPAAAARARQAPRQGPDVHRAPAHGGRGAAPPASSRGS
jgi:1,4-dihydroxy-2-naphthoyl-CoA synthase